MVKKSTSLWSRWLGLLVIFFILITIVTEWCIYIADYKHFYVYKFYCVIDSIILCCYTSLLGQYFVGTYIVRLEETYKGIHNIDLSDQFVSHTKTKTIRKSDPLWLFLLLGQLCINNYHWLEFHNIVLTTGKIPIVFFLVGIKRSILYYISWIVLRRLFKWLNNLPNCGQEGYRNFL